LLSGNDWGFLIDDEDYIVDSRVQNQFRTYKLDEEDDDDLSDEIKWKLFLARQLALIKYRQKWA